MGPGAPAAARDHEAIFVLDRALHQLADPSSDYRKVLQRAIAGTAPGGAASEVGNAIRSFLERVPPPGAGFRCGGDFLRRRARHLLWRLRETLTGDPPAPAEPAVCYAFPYAVDLTQPVHAVHIYGFDFDAAPLQMVLVRSDGSEDVTAALVQVSHSHLTLNLEEGKIPFSATSRSLALAWGHLIRHSIPLVQPGTRLCSSRIETVAARTITYSLPQGGSLARGDVWADALLDYSNNKLEAALCVVAARAEGKAIRGGCTVEFLYTTDADRRIDAIVGDGSRLVREWLLPGRRRGREGSESSVTARLNPIAVVSSKDEGCISAIAYLEAKRTAALGPSVRRLLNRQLRSVDPAVRRLRPRFAPS